MRGTVWIQGCVIHSQWNKHVYGQAASASPPSCLFITGAGTYATNPLLNVRIHNIKIVLPLDPQVWHSPMSKLDENSFYSKFCRVI